MDRRSFLSAIAGVVASAPGVSVAPRAALRGAVFLGLGKSLGVGKDGDHEPVSPLNMESPVEQLDPWHKLKRDAFRKLPSKHCEAVFQNWNVSVVRLYHFPISCQIAFRIVLDLVDAEAIIGFEAATLLWGIWPADPATGRPLLKLAMPGDAPCEIPTVCAAALGLITYLSLHRIISPMVEKALEEGIWPRDPETGRPLFTLAEPPAADPFEARAWKDPDAEGSVADFATGLVAGADGEAAGCAPRERSLPYVVSSFAARLRPGSGGEGAAGSHARPGRSGVLARGRAAVMRFRAGKAAA